MDSFMYFRVCNHEFKSLMPPQETEETITSSSFTQHSLSEFILDGTIPKIQLISTSSVPTTLPPDPLEYNNAHQYDYPNSLKWFYDVDLDYYYDFSSVPVGSDISPVDASGKTLYTILYNKVINWLVRPPVNYKVIYQYQPTGLISTFKTRALCDRCNGFGWYVDITDITGKFSNIAGIDKVAQRVIKDLLTPTGNNALDTNYGSRLQSIVFQRNNLIDDQQLFIEIANVISDIEQNYLLSQATRLSALSDDEILIRLLLNQAYRDDNKLDKIIVELFIETRTNARTLRVPV